MVRTLFLPLFILLASFSTFERAEAAVAGRNIAYFFHGYQSERSAAPEEPMETTPVEEIDRTGPGSVPLINSLESRISRYLVNDRCPIGREAAIQDRCNFLLRVKRAREGARGDARLSPRSRNVIRQVGEGSQIRRTVGDTYTKQLKNTASVLRAQARVGGLRVRPRTLGDVQALKDEVERARSTRRAERESSVPLPIKKKAEGE